LNVERARDRYDLDPADIVRADRDARAEGLDVVGFRHSHPDHPAWPSQFDTDRAWVDYVYIVTATTSAGAADVNAFALRDESGPFDQIPLSTTPATAGRRSAPPARCAAGVAPRRPTTHLARRAASSRSSAGPPSENRR